VHSTHCALALTVLLPAAAGCTHAPLAEREIVAGLESISAARDAGATSDPAMALAEEKLRLAQRWVAARDPVPARWLAQQARVDAELARVRAGAPLPVRVVRGP
jgi:hypothetical protein